MEPGESGADTEPERDQTLRERYTEIARLAGGLAHEIKNPLSTLNLNLQLLAEDFEDLDGPNHRRALRRIETLQAEVQRLERILNAFLRFARVSELRLELADLNEVVENMIDFVGPQAEAAGIVARHDRQDPLPRVRLDVQLFEQALLNLVLNAQNAMPEGGDLILRTRADADAAILQVIDTGTGISPERMERIFEPFFSTRPGGNGLGLPTTKKIVEAHGGLLEVESVVGKGSQFTIRLPAAREIQAVVTEPADHER